MRRVQLHITFLLLVTLLTSMSFSLVFASTNDLPQRKIVVFREGSLNEAALGQIEKLGAVKIKELRLINGMAVYLPNKASERAISALSSVLRVEDDIQVEALALKSKKIVPQPPQSLPWGVDKIDAELAWSISEGDPVKVAVLDTGIDVKHPDLAENIKGGFSAVKYTTEFTDDNGHGTHVAGVIAALNNLIGVVGVGPKVDLYAVKVLGKQGKGYTSDIIAGLEWCVKNGVQVINMSFGSNLHSRALERAIKKVNGAGIIQVAAAGNDGPENNTVDYPARFEEVIAVGATDQSDMIAYFSSRGKEVDFSAPGVRIYSTYKGYTYRTASGTSMAAPHVAGAAALVLTRPLAAYDVNSNGKWDQEEVKYLLSETALDLGDVGFDSVYGHGRVNVYSAMMR